MQLGNNVFGSYSRVTVKDVAGPFLHAPPSAFRNVVWLEEDNARELAQAIRAASRYLSNDEGSNSTLTEVPVSATLTELKIGRGCYNKVTALDLSGCARLESVEIGDFSLINCVLFKCCGLKALRRIVVGEKCFCFTQGLENSDGEDGFDGEEADDWDGRLDGNGDEEAFHDVEEDEGVDDYHDANEAYEDGGYGGYDGYDGYDDDGYDDGYDYDGYDDDGYDDGYDDYDGYDDGYDDDGYDDGYDDDMENGLDADDGKMERIILAYRETVGSLAAQFVVEDCPVLDTLTIAAASFITYQSFRLHSTLTPPRHP